MALCFCLAAGALIAGSAPAAAGPVTEVTLASDRPTVPFGGSMRLSGDVTPAPAAGETVEIRDATTDELLVSAATEADGSYEIPAFEPDRSRDLKAVFAPAESDPVPIKVRAVTRARLGRVLLFGKTRVSGRARPGLPGEQAEIRLLRGSRVVASRMVAVGADGRVAARFPVSKIGKYRGQIVYHPTGFLRGSDTSRVRRPPLPKLSEGSKGMVVRLLERRLRTLKYYLTGVNARFDQRTGDAVLAFHKVQGMARSKTVSLRTWRRLTRPRRPSPMSTAPRFHVEIDQTKQVLYVVRRGKISEIVHTSTGRNNWTRDGLFRVHRKIAGYSPGRLYYPSYFDGNRAVHGWPSVPTYPASHGCSRVPNWTAIHLHDIMPIGTVVRVYH